ncbi:MAG: MBOAT family protein [Spirochaetales bacterium]|nr:MAG: MBOAT family protein [Spirochaetales bacterium]
MVFSSPLFLFLFLPIFLGIYFLVPARYRSAWILAGSWVFYGFWRIDFLFLLIAVSIGNWLAGLGLARESAADGIDGRVRARRIVVLAVSLNLAVLGYFKYFNFGIDTLNALFGLGGSAPLSAWNVVLPVGISFYVFQSMSYVIDVYRGDAPPAHDFIDLAAYVALFPQLVAGPILRYKDLAGQLRQRTHSSTRVAYGLGRFVVGLCRKVLIADAVAPIANAAFSLVAPSASEAWLGVLAYAVQLYFDFSGYSDMAIGLGHMMGFTFMENFDTPYRASSVTDFWRRWHISLSSWLRDYLYLPLGGNRRSLGRTYLNLFLVMAIGGLWHGASWSFVLWGCWHGVLLAIERLRRDARSRQGLSGPVKVGIIPTQLAVLLGWVLFRATDLGSAAGMLSGMVGARGWALGSGYSWQLGGMELLALAAGLVLIAVEPRARERARAGELAETGTANQGRIRAGGLRMSWPLWAVLGVLAVIKLAADSYSPFLYFQF